jgi:hypothetical protein
MTDINIYRIESKAGVIMGDYLGATEADALDEMAVDLGYDDMSEMNLVTGNTTALIVRQLTAADYPL